MVSIRLFERSDHAATYAMFRPTYPMAVFDTISRFIEENGCSGFDVAVDVACGSGQSTFPLCNLFKKVIGVDISEAQITNARAKAAGTLPDSKSVEFMVGDAHDLPLESSSADLITCATAWHWLDPELFYSEAKRVIKPKGCLAVYGYCEGSKLVGENHCQSLVLNFINCLKKEGFWHERNLHCKNKYAAVKLPFTVTKRYEFLMPWESYLSNLLGLLSSTAGYHEYCEKYPGNTLLQDLQKAYLNAQEEKQVNPRVRYVFEGFAILGKGND